MNGKRKSGMHIDSGCCFGLAAVKCHGGGKGGGEGNELITGDTEKRLGRGTEEFVAETKNSIRDEKEMKVLSRPGILRTQNEKQKKKS